MNLRISQTQRAVVLLAVATLLLLSSALAQSSSLPATRNAKSLVGNWELFLAEDGKDPQGSTLEFPVAVNLQLEGDQLVGQAIFPEIRASDQGPKKVGETVKPLVELSYQENVLAFKIEGEDKGDFVALKLQRMGEKFEGRWAILRSGEVGTVKMRRVPTAVTSLIEKIVGEWTVLLTSDSGAGAGGVRLALVVKANGDKLTAKTLVELNGEKKEWQLIDPRFEGETFLFKVNNGEEVLEGKLKLVEDRFEGPWKALESGVGGTMKLIRKN
jgi:hypothetical protein